MAKEQVTKYGRAAEEIGPLDGLGGTSGRLTINEESKRAFTQWVLRKMLDTISPADPAAVAIVGFIEEQWHIIFGANETANRPILLTDEERGLLDPGLIGTVKSALSMANAKKDELVGRLTDLRAVDLKDMPIIISKLKHGKRDLGPQPSQLKRLLEYGARLGLSPEALEVIQFLWDYNHTDKRLDKLFQDLQMQKSKNFGGLLSVILGGRAEDYVVVLDSLMSKGFVSSSITKERKEIPNLSPAVLDLARIYDTADEMLDQTLGEKLAADFPRDAFPHAARVCNAITEIALGVLQHPVTGKAIYFYSQAGAGKTEMLKALAAETDVDWRFVAERSQTGEKMTAESRIARLFLAMEAVATVNSKGGRKIGLIFEEADRDLLIFFKAAYEQGSSEMSEFSKLFFTRKFDRPSVPIVLTGNVSAAFWSDFISTRLHPLQMRAPSGRSQIAIISRLNSMLPGRVNRQDEKLGLQEDGIKTLAQNYWAVPRVWASIVAAASYSNDPMETARFHLLQQARAGNVAFSNGEALAPDYDPDLVNMSNDNPFGLSGLQVVKSMIDLGMSPWVAVFQGPPGTSKSQTALYVADKIGTDIIRIHLPSILSSPNPVGSVIEQFMRAEDEGYLTVFDEAEAILSKRGPDSSPLHLAIVGAFNTQLSVHRLPVILTTNMGGALDSATLRRTPISLTFETMEPAHIQLACAKILGNEVLSAKLAGTKGLVVADFAEARRQAVLFNVPITPHNIVPIMRKVQNKRKGNFSALVAGM